MIPCQFLAVLPLAADMKPRKENSLIRKSWPKIRLVWIKGEKFFQVDARRKGTAGKRETFAGEAEAKTRAAEIEKDFGQQGAEGLNFSPDLRLMAQSAEKLLLPWKKTILDAAQFYAAHLAEAEKIAASATIEKLAGEWIKEKENGKNVKLREYTLIPLRRTADTLKKLWPKKTVLAVTTSDVRQYLDSLECGLRNKFNICSRFSQFFNWCIAREHLAKNPCDLIEITPENAEIKIFVPSKAEQLLRLCENQFPAYTLFYAISLFAGLRPEECKLLKWENVNLEAGEIFVCRHTSKIKEDRTVAIEPVLKAWLARYQPKNAKGFVTPQAAFKKITKAIHVALGFRGGGKNQEAETWPQDVTRHSYGSYWLAKYKDRAHLAENMGNSIQIIKKHYKRAVSAADAAAFWMIAPEPKTEAKTAATANASDPQAEAMQAAA